MAYAAGKLKKGDTVQVQSGVERGKQAKVVRVIPRSQRVLLEGLFTSRKHRKPRKSGEKGEIVSISRSVSVAKLLLVCPHCKKPTRVGITLEGGAKKRVCKKCHTSFA